MTVYVEGDLRLDFSSALRSTKFDTAHTHGLTHCMKAVDFLVETPHSVLLVEVKDPDHPRARAANVADFESRVRSGELTSTALVPKCRDTFLYEWCCQGRDVDLSKPWHYLVLIALQRLQPPELMGLTDELKRTLPIAGPAGYAWRPFVTACQVFNLATWQRHLGDQFPVTRLGG